MIVQKKLVQLILPYSFKLLTRLFTHHPLLGTPVLLIDFERNCMCDRYSWLNQDSTHL
ncbi:hypothetical protein NTGM5_70071 [Candidatus Nitrotoga sp. M5]|nr:hypothetical protein NTGM5_70071 [Candidatus Nitrotoga sp. M5]